MHKLRSRLFNTTAIFVTLNIFFLSIALLGAFKGEGKEMARTLMMTLYNNPFLGLMIGVFATVIMQSSSSTTSIVVSFVATGLFGGDITHSVYAAIPIIMGANIGTSVTNAIVSIGHIGDLKQFRRAFSAATVHDIFNLLTVIILFPIQVYTNFLGKLSIWGATAFSEIGGLKFASPIKMLIKPQKHFIIDILEKYSFVSHAIMFFVFAYILVLLVKKLLKTLIKEESSSFLSFAVALYIALFAVLFNSFSEFLFNTNFVLVVLALSLMFGALAIFVKIVRKIITGKVELLFNDYIFKTHTRAFVVGLILTVIVQSSSVTTSIVVPLAGIGILNVQQIFPYTLGANIGTTITALLAALSLGNIGSLAVAFAHLLFNIIGTAMFMPFRFMRNIPIYISHKFADFSVYSRVIPVLIVVLIYIVLPLLGIILTR